jgi:hypothetical protein
MCSMKQIPYIQRLIAAAYTASTCESTPQSHRYEEILCIIAPLVSPEKEEVLVRLLLERPNMWVHLQ